LNLIEVGTVARAHGVRGEVRVRLHWPSSDALDSVKQVWLQKRDEAPRPYEVLGRRRVPKAVLLRLAGVDDRDAADHLRGVSVSVPRDALEELAEGEYYLCDLVGARVVGPDGPVGTVLEVRVHPSVDSIIVQGPDGKLLEQPLVSAFVETVDAGEGVVVLSTLDGLV
jgi:16S rRNA processing protein RimM